MKIHLQGKRGIVCGAKTLRFTKVPSLVTCDACRSDTKMADAETAYAQQSRRLR